MRIRTALSIFFLLFTGLGAVPAGADEHAVEPGDDTEPVVEAEAIDSDAETSDVADSVENDTDVGEAADVESETAASNGTVEAADQAAVEDEAAADEEAEEDVPVIEELTPHSAEYRVKISVLSGRLNTSLVRTDTGYEANHRIRPTGLARMVSGGTIEEYSSFENTENGIVPVHYVSNDSLTRDKTRADVDFDWETNTITGTVNDEAVEVVLEEFAHDRVSTQYQLMSDLMNGGVAERYVLYDIDEIKILNVSIIGEREIRVPAGEFTAIGVQHQAEGSSRVTTLWCVEELDYLPVMIEQHRRDELRMRASLRSYSPIEG